MVSADSIPNGKTSHYPAPTPVPLLPDEGKAFLERTIQPDAYLAGRRRQAHRQALRELQPESAETLRSPQVLLAVVVVVNLGVTVASVAFGEVVTAILALLTGLLCLGGGLATLRS